MTEPSSPYNVPKEPGRWRAIMLAALVHAALLAFLWIGVQWQSETPTTLEAEIWTPPTSQPVPEPVKAPEPKPEPVVKAAPPPKVEEPPVPDPDIALEQEKKRKRLEEEKRRLEEKKRLEEEKLAQEKKRREEERLAEEKKRKEEERLARLKKEEAARREKEQKEKAERERKAAEEKRRQQEEEERLAKARQAEMDRITGGAGTAAASSQGGRASAEYGAKVATLIKSHTVFNVPNSLSGNPPVEYAVELLPDGSLRGTPRKLKSSGVPGFDEAVLRAIEKSQPFPRDERSGNVPSSFTVSHKPKDQ